jgi:putative ABC transport system permease protein
MTTTNGQRHSGSAVRVHPVRAVLDSFATAAGVAAVVLAVAVIHSASALVKGPIDGLDADVVVVAGTAPSSSGVQAGFVSSSLTRDDIVALGHGGFVPDGLGVAPTTGLRTDVHSLDRTSHTDVIGSNDAFASVRGYALADGRFLTPADVQVAAPVVVLGQTVINSLFAGADPVGRSVVIGTQTFHVVGALRGRGFSGAYDQDDLVVIPMTTAWNVLLAKQNSPIDQVLIRAGTRSGAAAVAREATTALLQRHSIVNPARADFTVQTQQQLAARRIRTALGLKRVLELAGGVLLLAGAIHLATVAGVRRWSAGRLQPAHVGGSIALAAVLVHGLIAAVVGVGTAIVLAPALHRIANDLPTARVSVYGAAAGAAVGVASSVLALLPDLWRRAEGSTPQPKHDPADALEARPTMAKAGVPSG